jgi:tetratricopeptide (TPR) repeat protein
MKSRKKIWNMAKVVLFAALVQLPIQTWGGDRNALLQELDRTIDMRPELMQRKERGITQLKRELLRVQSYDLQAAMHLSESLWQEYSGFNSDSASYYADQMHHAADQLHDQPHMIYATLHKAEALMTAGMFKEAFDLLVPIRSCSKDPPYATIYFHLCRTLYGYMTDYAVTPNERALYDHSTTLYRDSVLSCYQRGSNMWRMICGDDLTDRRQPQKALKTLLPFRPTGDRHFDAAYYYTLAEAYMAAGDRDQAFDCYTQAAINDMKNDTREYASLRKLAMLLYEQDDVDRAYRYLSICMEDAKACNARLRILEILDSFPTINQAFLAKKHKQQMRLVWAIIAISLLAALLLVAYRYVVKQKRRLLDARKRLYHANEEMKAVNRQLKESNLLMERQQQQIAENSYLKEIYIGRYMDQCSSYLDKLDHLRRSLRKLVDHGGEKELQDFFTFSSKELNKELLDFYDNFDDTFLELFPTFVADFNALLQEGEQIVPKPGHKLNTELRIFALIRLGITDSVKIAQFLRYSTTTIYNYRTRVRNKARGNRDELEKQVQKIGRVDSEQSQPTTF